MGDRTVSAFEVWARWSEHRRTVNARTLGAAKYDYLLDVQDCWPDVKFTDIRGRRIGAPHTSEDFIRNARYRGMPDIRCGDAVTVKGDAGIIVGHNSSANFDVLFDKGTRFAGLTLNVHPSEITRAAAAIGETK